MKLKNIYLEGSPLAWIRLGIQVNTLQAALHMGVRPCVQVHTLPLTPPRCSQSPPALALPLRTGPPLLLVVLPRSWSFALHSNSGPTSLLLLHRPTGFRLSISLNLHHGLLGLSTCWRLQPPWNLVFAASQVDPVSPRIGTVLLGPGLLYKGGQYQINYTALWSDLLRLNIR